MSIPKRHFSPVLVPRSSGSSGVLVKQWCSDPTLAALTVQDILSRRALRSEGTGERDGGGKPRWRNTTKLYLSRALSSWGDNMWSFAVGLFYIKLYPDSLRLAAIYGFSASVAIILFGAPIGRWVDKTARLKGNCLCMRCC